MRTIGLSNKLLATLAAACGAQLVALLTTLAATGEFDRLAWAQLAGLALTTLASLLTDRLLKTLYTAAGAQLVALLVQLAASGHFDRIAAAQVGGLVLTALLGGAAGYRAAPDQTTRGALRTHP